MDLTEYISEAIATSNAAQRNYDLDKEIPQEHINLFIEAATKSPSKQNETHYSLYVYTDKEIIRQVYNHTKKFLVMKDADDQKDAYGEVDGKYWQDDNKSVTNSQILANALFVFVDEEGKSRGGTHSVGQESLYGNAGRIYLEQRSYSIGIAVGELILSANLLDYRTGICSAMDDDGIRKLLNLPKRPRLLVGVGHPNEKLDRRMHPEVFNRDMREKHRTGDVDENWTFPSFPKTTKVFFNNEELKDE